MDNSMEIDYRSGEWAGQWRAKGGKTWDNCNRINKNKK